MKNRLFVIAWLLISVLLIVYTIVISELNRRVIGITEVEETTISFPYPVEVTNVDVVTDQQIIKGELLLELRSEDLEQEAVKLKLEISKIEQQILDIRRLYQSKLERLKREKRLELNKLESELVDLQIEIENDQASAGSLNYKMADSLRNPKSIMYQNMEKEIQLTSYYFDQLISVEQLQLQSELTDLGRELEIANERQDYNSQKRKQLRVLALYDGYIKKIRVDKYTLLEAFTPLVTYSKLTPAFVRAYTDENTRLEVSLGSTVSVASATRKWITTKGVILSGSKRITELPERLKIQPYSQEWGQEFLIKLPEDNEFLVGEKVLIR